MLTVIRKQEYPAAGRVMFLNMLLLSSLLAAPASKKTTPTKGGYR